MALVDKFTFKDPKRKVSISEVVGMLDVFVVELKKLRRRVADLESTDVSKALDAEAFESMAEMVERLDRLEAEMKEIADNGLRYRGYWKRDTPYRRGDAVTYDGSLWRACQASTSDPPTGDSPSWTIAVRKGRDSK